MSGSAPRGRSTDLPAAIVQVDTAEVNDERIGCLLVGPGMGDIPQVLTLALTSQAPKVIDADAISHLGEPERLKGQDAIITPHEGEFEQAVRRDRGIKAGAGAGGRAAVGRGRGLQGARHAGRIARWTRWASPRRRRPGWRARGRAMSSPGMIAALRARGLPAFEAACAGGLAARARGRDRRPGDDRRRPRRGDSAGARRARERADRPHRGARRRRDARAAATSPFGVPGDVVLDDGALAPGPHHQAPPCRHFPECGGCQLQHADDEAYRGYLVSRVETALAQHELTTEIREPHLSPPEQPPPGDAAGAEGRAGRR